MPNLDGLHSDGCRMGTSSLTEGPSVSRGSKQKRTEDDHHYLKAGSIMKKLRRPQEGDFIGNDSTDGRGDDGVALVGARRNPSGGGFPMPPLPVEGGGDGRNDKNAERGRMSSVPSLSSFRRAWKVLSKLPPNEVDGVIVDAEQVRTLLRESFGRALSSGRIRLLKDATSNTA
jgi:hypothetical protein